MSRPLRLVFPGALYHITARGNRRGAIYLSDDDRCRFNELLSGVVSRFAWRIHAWCQMSNHYHLLVETPQANLPEGMRQLNGKYANYFNHHHHLAGHVFQGRYTAIHVDRERYFRELLRYVVLNPVRAGIVEAPERWSWSSYRETVGLQPAQSWSSSRSALMLFGETLDQAVTSYRSFVADGIRSGSPWDDLKNGVFLGSEEFVGSLLRAFGEETDSDEIPRRQRECVRKSLNACEAETRSRDEAIVLAYQTYRYTLKEIGLHFGLHYSRVSRIVKRHGMDKAKGKT